MGRVQNLLDSDQEELFHYESTNRYDSNLPKPWNVFKTIPLKVESGSTVDSKWIDGGVKIVKFFTIIFIFAVVLGSAIVSKGSLLFITSQIKKVSRPYCNRNIDRQRQFIVELPTEERVVWMWMIIFTYFVPELFIFVRSLRKCCFKKWVYPTTSEFLSLLMTETLPAIGSAILVFEILPELDVIKAAMLSNAFCFIPGFVEVFSRDPKDKDHTWKLILDIASLIAQATAFIAWPQVEGKPRLYLIPVVTLFISFGWWENFITEKSPLNFVKNLKTDENKKASELFSNEYNTKYFMYLFISPWKCLVFFSVSFIVISIREGSAMILFDEFNEAFSNRNIYITEIKPIVGGSSILDFSEAVSNPFTYMYQAYVEIPLIVMLINTLSTYICYAFGKFACKVLIQGICFAFPIHLTVPVLVSGLVAMCGLYNKDECYYSDTIPPYLFFNTLPLSDLKDFLARQYAWVWLVWLMSQVWITIHIWTPNNTKLASTEDLFLKPMYDAFLIDQSLAMNRRQVPEEYNKIEEHEDDTENYGPSSVTNDKITKIYACGTMWHETKEEMLEFLKSIMRMDEDQCVQRIVRNYLKYNLASYYELETHIWFDDAFVRQHTNDNDPRVNEFVESLIGTVNEAVSEVHQTIVKLKPPTVVSTPYGGQLIWTLPGKTKMVAHLKDKAKIRPKKRWSQVMYMYYLLGHRLMESDNLTPDRINTISENTYILALDGDIDFQPEAVHLLIDLMKRNSTLGAACGRLHPLGSGALVWYQIFEYAVGHWLQKATEHVIGCVLCSPGCFSLFRAKALMDHNVMAKYTTKSEEAKHYIQYDQGEDRWLCTLLLQRGWRVEYCAASDAYTHCPEGFNEFYNQRRRWMPSTTANILDLLYGYKHIVHVNEHISTLYIAYQVVLMIGTVIGPGTILLMLIGAFVAAFKVSQWVSFMWNIVPILLFVIICLCCKSDTQLFFAALISAVYGLIMMAVLVGIMLQISEDGFLAPSALFFFCLAGEFIVAALLHPKEFHCLKYGIIYYVTVPSMYLLLVIYSVFNMNNVSWGTRDVTVKSKIQNTDQEIGKQPAQAKDGNRVLSFFGADQETDAGSIEFSCANLFKCFLCTHQKNGEEKEKLRNIQLALQQIQNKLDCIEKFQLNPELAEQTRTTSTRKTVMFEEPTPRMSRRPRQSVLYNSDQVTPEDQDFSDETSSSKSESKAENSWFSDVDQNVDIHYLSNKEETFWQELIDEYLYPMHDDDTKKTKVAKELKDLRDQAVTTFFMINALFVLVVFLLTLQKDTLHVDWPIDAKVNFTYVSSNGINEILISKEYLQLEPIGFTFLLFFGLLMGIQFFAMLKHRFGTFSQITANTSLDLELFETKIDKMTDKQLQENDPVKIFKKLVKLKGINDEIEEKDVKRRNTVYNLAMNKQQRRTAINDLDKAFHIRMHRNRQRNNKSSEIPKEVLTAIYERRKTVLRRPTELPNLQIYDNGGYIEDTELQ